MRAAAAALIAGSLFLAGVLVGSGAPGGAEAAPAPVVLDATPGGSGQVRGTNTRPSPAASLDVQEVEHEVGYADVQDYEREDHSGPGGGGDVIETEPPEGEEDSSGPGSGETPEGDNSGPGSSDNSGPGSDSSGSGSSGSGSSGSG